MFNFVVDRTINGRAYPNLARLEAQPYTPEWQEFVHTWPYVTPCELIEHLDYYGIEYHLHTLDNYPDLSVYPVGIGFFDFTIDYFSLMSDRVHEELSSGRLRVLFYYHEGDNPLTIQERLDSLALAWQLPANCYLFVSGNSTARTTDRMIYFPDHELLYARRNANQPAMAINTNPRSRDFTLLSRLHKHWRATVVVDLLRNHLLDNSYWSYNTQQPANEPRYENPLLGIDNNLEMIGLTREFMAQGPYRCDTLTSNEHNDHSYTPEYFYQDSLCNIVLETVYDADQSGGTFLTEKTFKPIKHGQPFVIVGPQGSLALLRRLGYRTFDHAIDNSYDSIEDNNQRWRRTIDTIRQIHNQDPVRWFEQCLPDLEHNQQLFAEQPKLRLNTLHDKLLHILATT